MSDADQPADFESPTIALVVFDLGRVLLRIADDWDHAARLAGLPDLAGLTGDLSTKAARGRGHPLAEAFDRFETGHLSVVDFLAAVTRETRLPAAQIQRVLDAVLIETYPGAIALLDRLRDLPVKTACLSNTNARHWQLFNDREHPAYLPLELLDYPLASQIVRFAKPDPAIYRYVEEGTGVAPRQILFFDDLPENLDAARQRGWQTHLIPRDLDNPVPTLIAQLRRYGVLED